MNAAETNLAAGTSPACAAGAVLLETRPAARYGRAAGMIALMAVPIVPDFCLSIFAPAVARHFGLDKAGQGLLLSAGAWGGLAGTGAFLLLARRPAGQGLFRLCIGLIGLCALAAAFASRPLYLMVAIAAASGAFAVTDIASSALLPSLIPGSPRRILAVKYAAFSFIGIATPLVGGLLLDWSSQPGGIGPMTVLRTVYAAAGIALIGGGLLYGRQAGPTAGRAAASTPPGWALCLFPAILAALHGGTDSAMSRWAPTFYSEAFAQTLFNPAWVLSGCALAYFIGRTLLSVFPEGRGERFLLVVPGLTGGGLALAALNCPSFGLSVGLYVAASLCYGLQYPILLGFIARRMPAHMGRTLALGGLASFALYGGLTVLVGAVARAAGDLRTAFMICPFGFIAFSLLAAVWLKGTSRSPSAANTPSTPGSN